MNGERPGDQVFEGMVDDVLKAKIVRHAARSTQEGSAREASHAPRGGNPCNFEGRGKALAAVIGAVCLVSAVVAVVILVRVRSRA